MENGYEYFITELVKKLMEATGYGENRIFFRKQGEIPLADGDRLYIVVAEQGKSHEACGFHVKKLYDQFMKGELLEDIVVGLLEEAERAKRSDFVKKAMDIRDYEKVKENLFVKLMNAEYCCNYLDGVLYQTVGDIAMVLHLKLGEEKGGLVCMKVRKEIAEQWGISEGCLFREALKNTAVMMPPILIYFRKYLEQPEYTGEEFMDIFPETTEEDRRSGICLTTTEKTGGAAAAFFPGVAERLGTIMGGNFLIAFTSIHEAMLHKEENISAEEVSFLLKSTVREYTPEEDFLTNRVYRYDREKKRFTCLQ